MTTGPLGRLHVGDRIDGEWEVDDVFQRNQHKIYVLKRIKDGFSKYLNYKELVKLFSGDRVR